jgi:hypothetical protein
MRKKWSGQQPKTDRGIKKSRSPFAVRHSLMFEASDQFEYRINESQSTLNDLFPSFQKVSEAHSTEASFRLKRQSAKCCFLKTCLHLAERGRGESKSLNIFAASWVH